MSCMICTHPKKLEIEKELLELNFGDPSGKYNSIAKKYKVDTEALQIHALQHMQIDEPESIVSKIKLAEAVRLQSVVDENYRTLKKLGGKIHTIIDNHDIDSPTLTQISKHIVELYLGCSTVIKDTVDSIVKMNLTLNGSNDAQTSSLTKLVEVLHGSIKDGD